MKNIKALTLTVIANITSNYGEGLGNVASVHKVFKNGNIYAMRSKESLKTAIMMQSGMDDDLKVAVNSVAQKEVTTELNASNCRALEAGYMNTSVSVGNKKLTYVRNSSFYLTDAIACEPFVNEPRFHNNFYLSTKYAKNNGLNVQNDSKGENKVGLMPYSYEYDKGMKIYSITFDLEMIGKDDNFDTEASNEEKVTRMNMILDAIENLRLLVKENLDDAEPLFVVGGLSDRKTHVFENVVKVKGGRLSITKGLREKIDLGYKTALLEGDAFDNEHEIIKELNPTSIVEFFKNLKQEVNNYYGV